MNSYQRTENNIVYHVCAACGVRYESLPINEHEDDPFAFKLAEDCCKESVGVKHDQDKIQPSLISPLALEELSKILTMGARKYSPDNWKLIDPKRYEDALIRHYIAYKKGEKCDGESGYTHLGHMFANVMFLLHKELEKNEDR